MKHLLTDVQSAVAECLRRKNDLAGTPVLTRDEADLESRLDESVKAGSGLCLVVRTPFPYQCDPLTEGPLLDIISVKVRIVELACGGEGGAGALELAERVTQWLHGWTPPVEGISAALKLNQYFPWDVKEKPDRQGRYIIEVGFYTSGSY